MSTTTTRPLHVIAAEIRQDWRSQGKGIYFGAKPYLEAMESLNSINDNYIQDTGKSIVCYFLANAGTWKGETAKRVKLELKKMAGLK
jgi:hypothetical protein